MLEDDPNFLPDFALAPLDLDDLNLRLPPLTRSTSLSSRSRSYSPRRSITLEEQEGGPVFGLQIPSSDSGGFGGTGGFAVPGDEGPGTRVPGGDIYNFEDEGFEPGVDFGFDAEGNFIDHAPADNLQRTPSTVARPHLPSSSAASARARQEHEEAQQHDVDYGDKMDIDMPLGDDDEVDLLPDAEPFPSAQDQQGSAYEQSHPEEEVVTSSESVQAPVRRRTTKSILQLDERIELRNADLANWMNGYLDNMRAAMKQKHTKHITTQAKKNAAHWVLGMGIGGIGSIIGNTGLTGPLDMFKGDALLLSLGIDRNADKKKKREAPEASEEDNTDEDGRRVRQRSDEHELGRGDSDMEDGGPVNVEDEEDVEFPREEELEKEGRDLSQMFPWNVTASVRDSSLAPSARRALGFGGSGISSAGGLSSFAGPAGSLGRRSRIVSESPLHGRGQHHNLEPLPDSDAGDLGDDTLGGMGGDVGIEDEEAFQLYGPAAAVDTQTTTESHFARMAFAREMENFGMFVFDSLKRKEEAAAAQEKEPEGINEILFEDALPPESTTRVVAAQGFMHLLALASLGRVAARQDEPFEEIGMSLPHAAEAEVV